METTQTKDAQSHLEEDLAATYDALTAPATVRQPGHGKEAQHPNTHFPDSRGSTVKHVGHTRELFASVASIGGP